MTDILIIGGGPAGMSAALYGLRAGMECTVVNESPVQGGQVLSTYEVDNYLGLPKISGIELGDAFQQHAEANGANFVTGRAVSIEKNNGVFTTTLEDGEKLESKTVIYAAGAEHSKLGVKGEEELAGMGVSYCATCDGAFFKGATVAVVGGGDVAVEDAIYLARLCKKVYLIHRRDELRAANALQKELFSYENVEFLKSSVVEEIVGEDGVEGVRLKNVATGEEQNVSLDGVFIAVGIHPSTALLEGMAVMDESGYVLIGEDCKCRMEGLYAAGDVRKKPLRQIITAVADGANAATSAAEYLRK